MNKPLTDDEIKRIRHALDIAKTQFELDAKATAGFPRIAAEFTRYASECQAIVRKLDGQFELPENPKPTLCVIMEGGLFSEVVSDDPTAANAAIDRIVVVDYDTGDHDPENLTSVKQENGCFASARVYFTTASQATIEIPAV